MTVILAWNKIIAPFWPATTAPRRSGAWSLRESGFTLLEVMIAISLLAIALTTLFGSQSQSVSLASTVKFDTQAPLLAQMKMTEFATATDRLSGDSGDFGEEFPGFHWKLETEDAKMDSSELLSKLADDLQQLTLTVAWGDKDQYAYRLQTLALKEPKP